MVRKRDGEGRTAEISRGARRIVNSRGGRQGFLLCGQRAAFSGFVMTKERTSEQIISVTAYDQMFYLVRNKGTYVFLNKSAKEIIQTIGADYGLRWAISMAADGGFRRELRRGKR